MPTTLLFSNLFVCMPNSYLALHISESGALGIEITYIICIAFTCFIFGFWNEMYISLFCTRISKKQKTGLESRIIISGMANDHHTRRRETLYRDGFSDCILLPLITKQHAVRKCSVLVIPRYVMHTLLLLHATFFVYVINIHSTSDFIWFWTFCK